MINGINLGFLHFLRSKLYPDLRLLSAHELITHLLEGELWRFGDRISRTSWNLSLDNGHWSRALSPELHWASFLQLGESRGLPIHQFQQTIIELSIVQLTIYHLPKL